jgi:hypothetical protein
MTYDDDTVETLLQYFKMDRLNDEPGLVPPYAQNHRLRTPEGVVSFTHYEILDIPKHIILFGDHHNEMAVTDSGGQFMLDWIVATLRKKKNICLDLFLESRLGQDYRYLDGQGPMFGVVLKHKNIIKKFPNIRVHDINVRPKKRQFKTDVIRAVQQHYAKLDKDDMFASLLAAYMHIIFNIEPSIFDDYIYFKSTITRLRIIEKLRHDVVAQDQATYDKIRSLVEKQLTNSIFKDDKNSFFKCLFDASVTVFNEEKKFQIARLESSLRIVLMDAYGLARIFRAFKSKDRFVGPCSTHMPLCVVYAGEHHVKVYREFIRQYFGTRVKEHQKVFDLKNKKPILSKSFDLTEL